VDRQRGSIAAYCLWRAGALARDAESLTLWCELTPAPPLGGGPRGPIRRMPVARIRLRYGSARPTILHIDAYDPATKTWQLGVGEVSRERPRLRREADATGALGRWQWLNDPEPAERLAALRIGVALVLLSTSSSSTRQISATITARPAWMPTASSRPLRAAVVALVAD